MGQGKYQPTCSPFTVCVEAVEFGVWRRQAQGTSYEWLAEALAEAREIFGAEKVRLVAWWGDVVEIPAGVA